LSRDDLLISGYNDKKQRIYFASGAAIHGEQWIECWKCGSTEFRKIGMAQFGRILLKCVCCGRTLTKLPGDVTIQPNGIVRLNLKRETVKLGHNNNDSFSERPPDDSRRGQPRRPRF
jgi:hypothetical protein